MRALSIGTPRLWSVGEILTASNMNTYVSDILDDLKGTNGPIEYTDAIVVDSLTTTERNALTAANGMVIYNSTLSVFQRYENGAWVSYNDLAAMTIASAAQGDTLYIDSAGNVARLTAGTNRQALRTHGTSANPSFADLEDLRIAATTAQGDVFYVGSNGRLNRLAPGTSDYFFQTKGANANPVWAPGILTPTFVRLTTGTSWTVPTTANMVFVEVIGGGGGGGFGDVFTERGRPGEGGYTARYMFTAAALGTTVTYAIGVGGTRGSSSTAPSGNGGNTIFAGHGVGLGGYGGLTHTGRREATGQTGADGGDGGAVNATGGAGGAGLPVTVGGGTCGTVPGGAGGAGTASLNGLGSGGGRGGGGNTGSTNGGVGGAGGIPGGGGGGGGPKQGTGVGSNGSGGTGARGEIRIWWW